MNVAPLCRRHHRLKTKGGWSYYVLEPGMFVWRSPHDHQYLVTHAGTHDISPDRHHRRVAAAGTGCRHDPADPDPPDQ